MGRKAIEINALDCRTAADWLAYCASRRDWSQGDEPTVMISYNGNDSGYKDQLRKHLVPALSVIKDSELGRSFELWDFAKRGGGVHIGQHFPTEVAEKMWRCRAAVVVLSPEYIDSEYCFEIELPFLLWRWQQKHIDLFLFRLNSTVFDNRRIELPHFGSAVGHVLLSQLVDDRNPSLHLKRDPNNDTLFKQLYEDKPAKAEERLTRFSQGISESVELRQRTRESQPMEKSVAIEKLVPAEEPKGQGLEQPKTTTTSREKSSEDLRGEIEGAQKSTTHGIEFSQALITPAVGDPTQVLGTGASLLRVNDAKPHKPLTAAALIAVVSMIVAGGGAYYWQSDKVAASREALDRAIQHVDENSARVEQIDASRKLYREALDRAIRDANGKQALLAKENDELKATVLKRNLEIASLKTDVAAANGLMPAAMNEKRSLENKLSQELDANATLTKRVQALEEQRVKTVTDLQMKTRDLSESQLQYAQASEKISQLESANVQLQEQIAATDRALENSKKDTQDEVKRAVEYATATDAIWGAAARSNSGRVYNIDRQRSKEEAEDNVLALCRGTTLEKSVSGCKLLTSYSNSCFVIAREFNVLPNTERFVWTVSDDRQKAHDEMISSCEKKFRRACKVRYSDCSPDFRHSALNE